MLLPIHPQPQEDELLSSWVTRLATENRLYSHIFFKQLFGFNEPILTRDLDRLNSPTLIQLISNATHHKCEDIEKLKLITYEGEVFERLNILGNTRWVLPLKIYHRTKKGNGITYCPLCLKNDEIKYFRKSWRLAFICFCNLHNCVLLDKCHYCHASIDYQRIGVGSRDYELPNMNLGICHCCNKPLWHAPIQKLPIELELISNPYRQLLESFFGGNPISTVHGGAINLQLFTGLWFLICGLMHKRAEEVRKRIHIETGVLLQPNKGSETIEACSLEQRLKYIIVTMHYMQNWPQKFCELASNTKFTSSIFIENIEKLPFWLYSVVKAHLYFKKYIPSDEELSNAYLYLKKQETPYTHDALARLLGLHVSSLSKRKSRL